MSEPTMQTEGEVIRDTQVGSEGDDVPDRLQLQGELGREPRPYEGEGTHRFETRMSDAEIERGIGRDARHAAEVLHRQRSEQQRAEQQAAAEAAAEVAQGPVDLVPRPSEDEARKKALGSPQISPHSSQQL